MPAFEFNANELHRLRQLAYTARIPAMLGIEGSQRVRRAGEGLEFLDFRPYAVGDDLRHIDWNLYGRLRQLFVRVFESQKYLSIAVLVDVSRSMCFGEPVQKVTMACQLACALGYIALSHGERLSVATFAANLAPMLGPLHSMRDVPRVVEYLQASQTGQATNLHESVKSLCMQVRSRGLLVVLSDFLSRDGCEQALRLALSVGRNLLLVQILDDRDFGHGLGGSLKIRDSESGQARFVYVDDEVVQRYRQALNRHCEGLAAFCRTHGQYYVQVSTRDSFLETVCHTIRSTAVLR